MIIRYFIAFLGALLWFEVGFCAEKNQSFSTGKALFQQHCLSCHASALAPPVFDVQMRYQQVTSDNQGFTERMQGFVQNPTKKKALMKHAVKRFGLMPKIGLADDKLLAIVKYLSNEVFEPPCEVWAVRMKEARARRDIVDYHQHKKKIRLMCAIEGNLQDQDVNSSSMLAMMKKLGGESQRINHAIKKEDFPSIVQSAHRIAHHDALNKRQLVKLIKVLRSEMSNFKRADQSLKKLAEKLEVAAMDRNLTLVKKLNSAMQNECMACHQVYRSRVVEILYTGTVVQEK